MKISVCLPCHNDGYLLKHTLPFLKEAPINELVIVLDRCKDNSYEIIKDFTPNYKIVLIQKTFKKWKHGIAEAFNLCFALSSGDIIYTTASDFILDPHIFLYKKWFKHLDIISFHYFHGGKGFHTAYSNWLNNRKFIYTCKYGKWSGNMAFKRSVYEKLKFRDVRSPDLDFMNRAYEIGFTHKYVGCTNSIHLRSGNLKKKQREQGKHRKENHVNFLKVLAHSIFELKPYVLEGYLKA